jgi:hypothetical protein
VSETFPSLHALRQARFQRACWWLARDVAILPLKPRSKHLQPGYGPRQACITDPAFARRWFLNTDANLGIVLGGPANLLVADWDDASAFHTWRATVRLSAHDEALGAAVDSLTEQTARGYHVFFVGKELSPATGGACEFKTSGACMVSPSIHPSGVRYRVVHQAPIAPLDPATARALFPFLSNLAKSEIPDRLANSPSTSPQNGLIARIKAARSILDEMRDAGIELRPAGDDTLVGRCPFHDDHHPSLWVYPHRGLWGCNRPDCSAAGTHDVINFRAQWRGISNQAAIRQLADEFL